jgi:hypothetical protein
VTHLPASIRWCLAAIGISACTPSLALDIEWRMRDAHRLFVDGNPYRSETTALAAEAEESTEQFLRRSLRVDDLPPNPKERPSRSGVFRHEATQWNPADQRYRDGYLRPAAGFFVGSLAVKLRGVADGVLCTWTIDGPAGQTTVQNLCDKFADAPLPIALDTKSTPSSRPSRLSVIAASGESLSIEIFPKHYIVLGFGDSYSSGEGNPDQPAAWTDAIEPDRYDRLWSELPKYLERSSRWWDRSCHRSLYSWQSLTAIRMVAQSRSQVAVSFLGFACSGDEIFDGLLYARRDPPFGGALSDSRDGAPSSVVAPEPMKLLRKSQINNAVAALCREPVGPARLATVGKQQVWVDSCPELMSPDVVLLGIGGNDVKFSGVVAGVFLPSKGRTPLGTLGLKVLRTFAGTVSSEEAQKAARSLPGLYADLDKVMSSTFQIPANQRRIVFANYPNPMPKAIGPSAKLAPPDIPLCRNEPVPKRATLAQCRVHYNHLAMTELAKDLAPFSPSLVPEILAGEQVAVGALHAALLAGSSSICSKVWSCFQASGIDGTALNSYSPAELPRSPEIDRALREPTFLHDRTHRVDGLPDWHLKRPLSAWDPYVHPYLNDRFVLTFNDTLFTQAALKDCKGTGQLGTPRYQGYEGLPNPSQCSLDSRESAKGVAHLSVFAHAKIADAALEKIRSLLGLYEPSRRVR